MAQQNPDDSQLQGFQDVHVMNFEDPSSIPLILSSYP